MPHINEMPGGHDNVLSAYIIRTDTAEPSIMMHVHKKLGRYLQFGGHNEAEENPWQTLVHEIEEESGYSMSQLEVLQPPLRIKEKMDGISAHPIPFFRHTHSFDETGTHFHSDEAVVFVTNQPPANKPAKGEVQELELFTTRDMKNIPESELYQNVRIIATFAIEQILPNWERVPVSEFS